MARKQIAIVDDDHDEEIERLHDERYVGHLIDVHRDLNQLVRVEHPAESRGRRGRRQSCRSTPITRPCIMKIAITRTRRRPHRLQDRDVAALLPHEKNERRDDVERTDHDDQPDRDRDRHLLEPERREEGPIQLGPVFADVFGTELLPGIVLRDRLLQPRCRSHAAE